MPPHNHGHSCHDEHCDHDHSSDVTPALQNLLYQQIDFGGVRTLNEATAGSGRAVVQKPWADRLSDDAVLESDADEQLILHVPFTGQVRLHSIHVRTEATSSAPKTLHVFANTDDLDFSTAADASPTQTLELAQSAEIQDLGVKRPLFNATRSLTLFFPDNWSGGDEDVTRVAWIAFKGDYMQLNREPVEFLYEAAARPEDHKVKGANEEVGGMGFGGLGSGRQGF